jgi:3-hydroxyisobutyrate dehydrogenase-like beta-hydroxyacid dehydrogenase
MDQHSVGMVGLGLLGAALAERFLRSGLSVIGYDVNPDRRELFTTLGGRCAGSAVEVARACGRVVLSLPTSAVVEAVLDEAAPAWRAGLVVVDTTTGDPERTAALGARLAGHGVGYLDATVAGSSEQVRAGDVVVMVGGERALCDDCRDLFACFAKEWFYHGPWGSGARMKLVVNLVLGLNRAVLAEGLAFARACGLDPAEALRVLKAGAAYSRAMDVKGPKMIAGDFHPQAKLSQHLKDVGLILAEAERVGADVPLSELHRQLLERLVAAGLGDADNAAIIRAFESQPSQTSEAGAPATRPTR